LVTRTASGLTYRIELDATPDEGGDGTDAVLVERIAERPSAPGVQPRLLGRQVHHLPDLLMHAEAKLDLLLALGHLLVRRGPSLALEVARSATTGAAPTSAGATTLALASATASAAGAGASGAALGPNLLLGGGSRRGGLELVGDGPITTITT